MYNIAPQFIKDYLMQNFGSIGRISANDEEFVMESIFEKDDWKKHMSVNIYSGMWQCFKSGKGGNFVSLYAAVEGLNYYRAQRNLLIRNFEFLGEPIPELDKPKERNYAGLDTSNLIPLTLGSFETEDTQVLNAWNILYSRNLLGQEESELTYYLCTEGKFANRIIIPYFAEGVIFYFQGRALSDDQSPKYLAPNVTEAPKKSDVLYPFDMDSDILVICEGPTDAITLQLAGVNATCIQGSSVSLQQMDILSEFKGKIILGFDNDEAGKRSTLTFDRVRKEKRIPVFSICNPPEEYKDWNKASVKGVDLVEWVENNTEEYDYHKLLLASM